MDLPALTSPAQLWWLAAVLPALYWLAQPPRPRAVAFTPHWSQWLLAAAQVRQQPPRFRAWRWLLLSLAASAAVLAAAGPRGAGRAGPQRLVVLLDRSASMAADEAGQTVFARAVGLARQRLAEVPPWVEVEVDCLGGTLTQLRGPSARALAEPGEPAGSLPLSLPELAAAAAAGVPAPAVWVITDGQASALGSADWPKGCVVTALGSPRANAALRLAGVTDHWPAPDLDWTVEVHNFGALRRARVLPFQSDAVELPAAAATEADGSAATFSFRTQRPVAGGPFVVQLETADDALAADSRIELELPPLPTPRIAVLGDDQGAVFVQAAARALADELRGSVVSAAAGESASFLLVEGGKAQLPTGAASLAVFGLRAPAGPDEVWPVPSGIDWDRGEPLLAGLDFSDLYVHHALRAPLPVGKPLLTAIDGAGSAQPLVVLVRTERACALHAAFRLQDSNLPLLPAFPQLLRRVLLAGQGSGARLRVPPPVDLRESDLRSIQLLPAAALPPFGAPGADLAPWCLWFAALALALRAFLR